MEKAANATLNALKHPYQTVRNKLRHSKVLASLWRQLMFRTTVIAVSGSVGKTTCRELIYEILKDRGPTYKTRNNENDLWSLPAVLLRIRPWHKYAVIEVAASGPGTLEELARLVKPDVSILTAVARTHTRTYDSVEQLAHEKSQLVRHMRRRGQAILNGDDEHVKQMAQLAKAPAIFFGGGGDNHIRGTNINADWPEPMSMQVHYADGDSLPIQTQLLGAQWRNSVLAALATAEFLGVPRAGAVAAIARVKPFRDRMQPVSLPNGAVMVRDENGSIDVLNAMLQVVDSVRHQRRILVLGDMTDLGHMNSRKRLITIGNLVADRAEKIIFVGEHSHHAEKAAIKAGKDPADVMAIDNFVDTHRAMVAMIQPNDVVFIKGQTTQHLSRLVFSQLGEIGCKRNRCNIRSDCDICPHLHANYDVTAKINSNVWVHLQHPADTQPEKIAVGDH